MANKENRRRLESETKGNRELKKRRVEMDEGGAAKLHLLDLPVEALYLIFDQVLDGTPFVEGLVTRDEQPPEEEETPKPAEKILKRKTAKAVKDAKTKKGSKAESVGDEEEEEEETPKSKETSKGKPTKAEEAKNKKGSDDEDEDDEDEDDEDRSDTDQISDYEGEIDLDAVHEADLKHVYTVVPKGQYSKDLLPLGVQSACEHLVRCFLFSCKQLNQALINYKPLWVKLYYSLALPPKPANKKKDTSNKQEKEKEKPEAGTLLALLSKKKPEEITFELYRDTLKPFIQSYEFTHDEALAETDEAVKLRIGAFGKAAWAGYGVGCGRAGEYFSLNACRAKGYLFLIQDENGCKAEVRGIEIDTQSSTGRRGKNWEGWVISTLKEQYRPAVPRAKCLKGSTFDIHLSATEVEGTCGAGSSGCLYWVEDMEW